MAMKCFEFGVEIKLEKRKNLEKAVSWESEPQG